MKLIGFAGYARSGKDTAAGALALLDWKKVSFADPLKYICHYVTGVPLDNFHNDALKEVPMEELNGWTPRKLCQIIGTEGFRELYRQDVWAAAFKRTVQNSEQPCYSADVRFLEEVETIQGMGGKIIYVNNPHIQSPPHQHASETTMPKIRELADIEIQNDPDTNTIEALHARVLSYIWSL